MSHQFRDTNFVGLIGLRFFLFYELLENDKSSRAKIIEQMFDRCSKLANYSRFRCVNYNSV